MKRMYELITNPNMEFNESFLNEVFELLLKEDEDLKRFISDFRFDNNITSLGVYNNRDKRILVNPNRIEALANSISSSPKTQALSTIKHEMEHASNLRRLYEGGNDIESLIIRYSLVDYMVSNNIKYGLFVKDDAAYLSFKRNENYKFDPGERIADIKAERYVVNLLKNQRRSRELLVAKSKLYCAYDRGYIDNGVYLDAPTYTFLLNMGMLREFYLLKKRVDQKQYSFDTRVLLGLPLTYDEKDDKLLRRLKLQKVRR